MKRKRSDIFQWVCIAMLPLIPLFGWQGELHHLPWLWIIPFGMQISLSLPLLIFHAVRYFRLSQQLRVLESRIRRIDDTIENMVLIREDAALSDAEKERGIAHLNRCYREAVAHDEGESTP